MTDITIGELIALLGSDRAREWRFFDKQGREFVYDMKKAMFSYCGWDCRENRSDIRARHLRTPLRMRRCGVAEYMFARASMDTDVLRLWTPADLKRKGDPELTLRVIGPIDIEGAARPAPGAVSVSRNESPAAPVIYSGIPAYHLVWAGNMLDCGYVLTATHSSGTVTEKFRWSRT